MKHLLLFAAPLALISACSEAPVSTDNAVEAALPDNLTATLPSTDPANTAVEDPVGHDVEAASTNSAAAVGRTTGGDGSEIALTALDAGDVEGLPGELACGFRLADQRQPMLLGRANVGDDERAVAVIRNGGYAERLMARADGGFSAMERGGVFGGRGMTVTIERGVREPGGGESPAYSATLLAQRADGAERRYSGLWTCGP